ncbi:MAG: glycosyltransferase family 2 protein [Flavobacteriales bacterium]|nr:glycosyltransferase family 2 protein [Flavobacteriales bacterium]
MDEQRSISLVNGSVSVIMPVYEAAAFLRTAVDSALGCSEVGEVILVEDGSTDASLAICQDLESVHPRVRLIRHEGGVNRGAGASRNAGIGSAQLPFVAFLDADDYYLSRRFSAEHAIFSAYTDADGVYGAIGSEFHDEQARTRYMARFGQEVVTVHSPVAPEQLFSALLGGIKRFGHFSLDALTVRRESLLRMPSLFAEDLALHQDTDFLLRLAHQSRLYAGSIGEPVAVRRVHAGNRITSGQDMAPHRYRLYTRLEHWAVNQTMRREDCRRIVARRVYWDMVQQEGRRAAILHARHFIRHPWIVRWVAIRELWFSRLLGPDSRLARALRTITWRCFGDQGSFL